MTNTIPITAKVLRAVLILLVFLTAAQQALAATTPQEADETREKILRLLESGEYAGQKESFISLLRGAMNENPDIWTLVVLESVSALYDETDDLKKLLAARLLQEGEWNNKLALVFALARAEARQGNFEAAGRFLSVNGLQSTMHAGSKLRDKLAGLLYFIKNRRGSAADELQVVQRISLSGISTVSEPWSIRSGPTGILAVADANAPYVHSIGTDEALFSHSVSSSQRYARVVGNKPLFLVEGQMHFPARIQGFLEQDNRLIENDDVVAVTLSPYSRLVYYDNDLEMVLSIPESAVSTKSTFLFSLESCVELETDSLGNVISLLASGRVISRSIDGSVTFWLHDFKRNMAEASMCVDTLDNTYILDRERQVVYHLSAAGELLKRYSLPKETRVDSLAADSRGFLYGLNRDTKMIYQMRLGKE
jgi:hypothetical protein